MQIIAADNDIEFFDLNSPDISGDQLNTSYEEKNDHLMSTGMVEDDDR